MKTKIVLLFLIMFSSFSSVIQAQSISKKIPIEIYQLEDSLKTLARIIQKGKTEDDRYLANDQFKNILEKTLEYPESFTYSFDSLTTISKLLSPDKQIRIYNWILPRLDGTFEYFGYLQKKDSKNKFTVFPLVDKSEDIKTPEYKTLSNFQWYGALYYKIVQPKKRYKQYILLAWDGNDRLTNKKIIDVLFFDKNEPKFGSPIFKTDRKNHSRIIFEYNKDVSMSLKYDEGNKKIVFDHLEASHPKLTGQYQFYGPDFTYDSFEFHKGKWTFIKDIQPLNDKSAKDKIYNSPK